MAFYTTSSLIGVDFNTVGTTQLFALGTKASGTNNTEWVYCRAGTAVTAFKAVVINGTFTCAMPSVSDSLGTVTAGRLGWAQTAFAADEYGWIPINGVVYCMATASVTLTVSAAPFAIGASAVSTGMLVQSSASATVQGITPYAFGSGGQTATATAMQFILSWPRFGTPHF
jgi:hypothetical protein